MHRYRLRLLFLPILLAAGCAGRPEPTLRQTTRRLTKHPDTYTVGLSAVRYSGVIQKGGSVRLLERAVVQDDPSRIVFEAEEALEYEFQQGIGLLKSGRSLDPDNLVQVYARDRYEYQPQTDDPEASGSGYIDYTHRALYSITVTEPGEYTCWARHWVPSDLNWVYQHQVDDSTPRRIRLSKAGGIRTWYWENCGTWTLSKGTHNFILVNLHQGKRVDKFVLSRDDDFTPEGKGPAITPRRRLDRGYAVYTLDRPAALDRWLELGAKADTHGGAVTYEASFDGGESWQRVSPGAALPPETPREPIRVKASLERAANDRPSPELTRLSARFKVNPANLAELENEHLRLIFHRKTGTLCGIQRAFGGTHMSPPMIQSRLFAVFVKRPKEEGRWLEFEDAELIDFRADARRVVGRFAFLDGRIRLTYTVTMNDTPFTDWDVRVENDSDIDVLNVVYPRLEGLALGATPENDILLWPYSAGEFYPNPASAGTMLNGYPGHSSFAFCDLFDRSGGLYLGLKDPFICATWLTSRPDVARRSIALSYERRHRIKPGADRSYHFQVGVHGGDWHPGADQYRKAFFTNFDKPDYPEWLVECDGWATGHAGLWQYNRTRNYDEVRKHCWLRAAELGLTYTQSWGSTLYNACYSYYLPRRECGGERLFAEMNKLWRDAGGHIGYYFHGNGLSADYIWMDRYFETPWGDYREEVRPPSWDFYARHRSFTSEEAVRTPEALLAESKEQHKADMKKRGGVDRAIEHYPSMCQLDPWFLETYLTDWTDRYILDYHCDTIYYDTMAFRAAIQEFNPYLGFHGEGHVAMPRMKFLRDNIERLRKDVPTFTQMTEGCGDIWGQTCYFLLSGFSRDEDVLRYTFPEMILFEGHANGSWGANHKRALSKSFAYGNKFDIITRSDFTDAILSMRQQLSPWLARARFLGNLGLEVSSANVLAKGFTFDAGGSRAALVTVWNKNNAADATIAIDPHRYRVRPAAVWQFELWKDPTPLDLSQLSRGQALSETPRQPQSGPARGSDKNGSAASSPVPIPSGPYVWRIPAGTNSALLWIEKAAPREALAPQVRYDGREIVVKLFNSSTEPIDVTLDLASRFATLERPTRTVTVAPGLHTERFECTNRLSMNVKSIVTCDVSWDDEEKRLLTAAGPIAEDGDFEYYHNDAIDPTMAYSGKRSYLCGIGKFVDPTNPAYGSVYPRTEWHPSYARFECVLVPGRTYKASFMAKGNPGRIEAVADERFSEETGSWTFEKVGRDKGWDRYEVTFKALGRTSLFIHAAKGERMHVDAVKVVEVGG